MIDIFYDCEFIDDGEVIELISIGMVDSFGNELYAVSNEFDVAYVKDHPWLGENVWPHLPQRTEAHGEGLDLDHPDVMNRADIARLVSEYILKTRAVSPGGDIKLWAWFSAYDHVVLAQLYGSMTGLPAHIPMVTHELVQLWEDAASPPQPQPPANQHDALADARWNRDLYDVCMKSLHEGFLTRSEIAQMIGKQLGLVERPPEKFPF